MVALKQLRHVWYVIDLGNRELIGTFAGGRVPPPKAKRLADAHTNATGETTVVALGVEWNQLD